MRKLLVKLQSSQAFWFLIVTSAVFFLLRLPSLFEPYWYGDEGIYEVIGLALSRGRLLYQGIWDNKPPLLYLLYSFFQGDQQPMKLLSLFAGLIALWTIFFLSKKLFVRFYPAALTTGAFALLFGLPLLEGNIANSENFMLPLNLLAAFLVFIIATQKSFLKKITRRDIGVLFAAGVLLGLSFLFKVVAVFDLTAFGTFIFLITLPTLTLSHIWHSLKRVLPLAAGFLTPILLAVLYFVSQHIFSIFIRSTFFSNIGYVNYGNQFIIPQGFLILKTVLLAAVVLILFLKRAKMNPSLLFVLLWLVFSVYNALFSQRPYTHYMLVLLPTFSLLLGLLLLQKKGRIWLGILTISLIILIYRLFGFYAHPLGYYTNFVQYVLGQKSETSYQAFFDQNVPRDYAIAEYINMNRKKDQTVLFWGNSGQLYKLTQTLPPGRYIVAYHVTMSEQNMRETEEALSQNPPTYIVIIPGQGALPYSLANYQEKLIIKNATIYEHIL